MKHWITSFPFFVDKKNNFKMDTIFTKDALYFGIIWQLSTQHDKFEQILVWWCLWKHENHTKINQQKIPYESVLTLKKIPDWWLEKCTMKNYVQSWFKHIKSHSFKQKWKLYPTSTYIALPSYCKIVSPHWWMTPK